MSWQRRGSRLWLMVVAGVLCAALGAVLQERDALDSAEMDTVDVRFKLRGDQAKPKDIVLVAIDFQSVQELRERFPLPRRLHARAIDRLSRAGARAIVYDVQFTEPTTARDDNALFDAIRRAGNVVLAT